MKDFSFSLMQNITFGAGSAARLPDLLADRGLDKVLVVTGPTLARMESTRRILQALEDRGIVYSVFSDVEPNPSIETVNKATDAFSACGAQGIVALGGGSPMDVAKAVGVLAAHGGVITDYEGAGKVPGRIVPLVAIPTTAGTGSEVTAAAVVTDHARHFKFSIISPEIIPAQAILDPELILSLPRSVAAAAGVDAIVHAIESYVSLAADPFSDTMAEKALELLGKHIRAFAADRSDMDAACGMLLGSTFAGIAFARAKLGNVHAMAHPLGGYFNIAHGVANAVLLPVVMEFNAPCVPECKLERIYRALSGDLHSPFQTEKLIAAIRTLCAELDIPKNLTELRVDPALIPNMAADAMKSGNVLVNPRPATQEDMAELFRQAM